MKRFLIFPCILCLVIGLLAGVLLPVDLWDDPAPPVLTGPGDKFTQAPGSSQPSGSTSGAASSDAPAPLGRGIREAYQLMEDCGFRYVAVYHQRKPDMFRI